MLSYASTLHHAVREGRTHPRTKQTRIALPKAGPETKRNDEIALLTTPKKPQQPFPEKLSSFSRWITCQLPQNKEKINFQNVQMSYGQSASIKLVS
jgi:hypothetical protein